MPSTYVRIVGSGRVYQGAAVVKTIVFNPASNEDWVDVYDGLDATSGEKVLRIVSAFVISRQINLNDGVRFNHGIYVTDIDEGTETTVFFEPLEL